MPAGYRRAGRLADGWFPEFGPGPELDAAVTIIAVNTMEAGLRSVDEHIDALAVLADKCSAGQSAT